MVKLEMDVQIEMRSFRLRIAEFKMREAPKRSSFLHVSNKFLYFHHTPRRSSGHSQTMVRFNGVMPQDLA